jgi:hypothetical protein
LAVVLADQAPTSSQEQAETRPIAKPTTPRHFSTASARKETSVAVRLKPGRIVRKRLHPIAQLRRMHLKRRARRADAAVAPAAATNTSTIITMLRVAFPPFLTPAGRA